MRKVNLANSLATRFPDVAAEWHPRNGDLQPKDVSYGSKHKAWFLCLKGCDTPGCQTVHEWQTTVNSRTSANHGCPFCSLNALCGCRSLAVRFPDLCLEWDYDRNSDRPEDISYASNQKRWWRCRNGCSTPRCQTSHLWESTIINRTFGGNGCPFCSSNGDAVCDCQTLATRFPDVASEWDYQRNPDRPEDVSYGSKLMRWWVCSNGFVHKWEASIQNRTVRKSGCPTCRMNKAESELESLLNDCLDVTSFSTQETIAVVDGSRSRSLRADAIIVHTNGSRALIELDGPHHFASVSYFSGSQTDLDDQIRRDCLKNTWAMSNGLCLLRISYREYGDIGYWLNRLLTQMEENICVVIWSNVELYTVQRNRLYGGGGDVRDALT